MEQILATLKCTELHDITKRISLLSVISDSLSYIKYQESRFKPLGFTQGERMYPLPPLKFIKIEIRVLSSVELCRVLSNTRSNSVFM